MALPGCRDAGAFSAVALPGRRDALKVSERSIGNEMILASSATAEVSLQLCGERHSLKLLLHACWVCLSMRGGSENYSELPMKPAMIEGLGNSVWPADRFTELDLGMASLLHPAPTQVRQLLRC